MEEQKRTQAAQDAIRRGDFDTAYRLINEHSDLRRRIGELGNLAVYLQNKKETARAAQVLSEAQRLTPNTDSSIERATDQIRFAGIAARMDANRGFEALRSAVVAINHANFAARWTKMEGDPLGAGRTNIGLEILFYDFNAGFGLLGRTDFDRALQLAQTIEMKEAALLAQLAVCRGVLGSWH